MISLTPFLLFKKIVSKAVYYLIKLFIISLDFGLITKKYHCLLMPSSSLDKLICH